MTTIAADIIYSATKHPVRNGMISGGLTVATALLLTTFSEQLGPWTKRLGWTSVALGGSYTTLCAGSGVARLACSHFYSTGRQVLT